MTANRPASPASQFLLLALLLAAPAFAAGPVRIYQNGGCGHCTMYLGNLRQMLEQNGYSDVVVSDYMQDAAARQAVAGIQQRFGVPLSMQGHMLVLVDNQYLFEGHVPVPLVQGYLKSPAGPLVVTQDSMDPASASTYYMLMDGQPHPCPVGQPLAECRLRGGSAPGSSVLPASLVAYLPFGLLLLAGGFVAYSLRGQ